MAALLVSLGCAQAAPAESPVAQRPASGQVQFPDIPLRRDHAAGESAGAAVAWAVLFLAVVAGVGLVVVRKGGRGGLRRPAAGWLRAGANDKVPKVLGRMALTQQASVHVVEWKGEELLLGCTSQTVAVLARAPAAPARTGKVGGGAGAGA